METQQTRLEDTKKRIADILKKTSGERLELSCKIYREIAACAGHEGEALEFFFSCSENIEPEEEGELELEFTEPEKERYAASYGKMIDGSLEALLVENLPISEFYRRLWEVIQNNTILISEKQKAFALYYIWIDARIPYFELEEGLKMSNKEYREYLKEYEKALKKARFILFTPTEQKTQRASRLISLLNDLPDDEVKAVLMAQILDMRAKNSTVVRVARGKASISEQEV